LTQIAGILSDMDTLLFYFMNGGVRSDFLDVLMPYLTRVSNWRVAIGILWGALFFFSGKRGRVVAILLLIAIAVSDFVGARVIKRLIMRPRPCLTLQDVHLLVSCGQSSSLPSIHALNIFTGATVFSAFYGKWTRVLLFTIAALVAFSRVYVGVHYPSDVLAGAVIGIAWGMTVVWSCRLLSAQGIGPVLLSREENAA